MLEIICFTQVCSEEILKFSSSFISAALHLTSDPAGSFPGFEKENTYKCGRMQQSIIIIWLVCILCHCFQVLECVCVRV